MKMKKNKIVSLGVMGKVNNTNGSKALIEIDLDENDDKRLSSSFTIWGDDSKSDNFIELTVNKTLKMASIVIHSILKDKDNAVKLHLDTPDYKWEKPVRQLLSQNGIWFEHINGEFIIDVPKPPIAKTAINWMSLVILVEGIEIELCAYSSSNGETEISFSRSDNDDDDPFDELVGFKNPVKALRNILTQLVSWVKLFNSHVKFRGDARRMRIYKKMLNKHNMPYVVSHDEEFNHDYITC